MPDLIAGRIVASHSTHGAAELDTGELIRCKYRRSVGRPVCGDRIGLHKSSLDYVVKNIESRRNQFVRSDQRHRQHVVAANLDRVVVVLAPYPTPSPDLLDRYLVAIHSLGIDPLIVLNKWDLEQTDEYVAVTAALWQRLEYFRGIGYTLMRTSCKGVPGTEQLGACLAQTTSILVGQSGVGKSSLINSLIPDRDIQTGAVSAATGKGVHTTTATTLYHLPATGALIDSPGVWEYGLWRMQAGEIARGFREFAQFSEHCRFSNCNHLAEPGCAVKAEVSSGVIPEARYQSYQRAVQLFSSPG